MQTSTFRIAAILGLGAAALMASAQNLVNSPSFEHPGAYDQQSFSYKMDPAWTVNDPATEVVFANDPNFPTENSNSGTYFAALFTTGQTRNLSQVITTEAGRDYTVSFYLRNFNDQSGRLNSLATTFGNGSLTLTNVVESNSYTLYSFVGKASGTSTTLNFANRNDKDRFSLDDVSVVAQPVPEPASVAALGLGALALVRRRRKA